MVGYNIEVWGLRPYRKGALYADKCGDMLLSPEYEVFVAVFLSYLDHVIYTDGVRWVRQGEALLEPWVQAVPIQPPPECDEILKQSRPIWSPVG